MAQRRYLVSYDIPDDSRRSAIAHLLSGWGVRVQFSVFECDLQALELTQMLRALGELMVESDDSILVHQCAAVGTPKHSAMCRRPAVQADFWVS